MTPERFNELALLIYGTTRFKTLLARDSVRQRPAISLMASGKRPIPKPVADWLERKAQAVLARRDRED